MSQRLAKVSPLPPAAALEDAPSGNDFSATGERLLTRERWIEIARIIGVGVLVFAFWRGWVPHVVLWATVAVGLYPLLKTGIGELVGERRVGTELFVSAATLIAVFGGEEVAGAVLMVIILFAEFIADLNTERTRASIRSLIGATPRVARVRDGDSERVVPVEEVGVGDVVLVRAGDQIPVDGTVVAGDGPVNEATITGESIPRDKEAGEPVYAGTILEAGALDVRTERIGADTTFARIMTMVEQAESSKAPVEKLADRVAAYLIPLMAAFLVVAFLVTHDVRKVVTLMVFTSPAELALATPIVIVAAIARAARSGILIKGGLPLEVLARVDTVVFDKTGTLTMGEPEVEEVTVLDPAYDRTRILRFAAAVERRSGHPIAAAVMRAAVAADIEPVEPSEFESIHGRGVRAIVAGSEVLLGNRALLADHAVALPEGTHRDDTTQIYLAVDRAPVGIIAVADQVRPAVVDALRRLKRSGIRQTVMLTGDAAPIADRVGAQLGIDRIEAELLPQDKVAAIEKLQREGSRVAMVGDGVNDAPALAVADVGIAMGAAGTRAALEAADIALMTDDLARISTARAIARRSYRTIKENLFVGIGVVHVTGIIAALAGWIGPVQAALIHIGPDIGVFLNSTKLLRVKLKD